MHLYLARHGESISNVKWPDFEHPGEINAELTEMGRKQAQALASWIVENVPSVDAIYASSLRRTVETAEIISEQLGKPIVTEDDLREGSYSYSDHSPIPDELLPVIQSEKGFNHLPFTPFSDEPAGMESYAHVRTRVGRFLDKMVERHVNQRVVVVMHGGVLNAVVDNILNVGLYRRCDTWIEYTAFSHFEYRGEQNRGPWRLYYLAQTEHLAQAGLPKSLEG